MTLFACFSAPIDTIGGRLEAINNFSIRWLVKRWLSRRPDIAVKSKKKNTKRGQGGINRRKMTRNQSQHLFGLIPKVPLFAISSQDLHLWKDIFIERKTSCKVKGRKIHEKPETLRVSGLGI
jgi:hypothetical protein